MMIKILDHLRDRKEIEAFSKNLTAQDLLYILQKQKANAADGVDKLAILLNGISPETFSLMFSMISKEELELLKAPKLIEPIQLQLTFLSHSLECKLNNLIDEIVETEREWDKLDFNQCSTADLMEMVSTIKKHAENFNQIHPLLEKALKLAWNTNRKDLIKSLSHTKERLDHIYITAIGYPESDRAKATGLYDHINSGIKRVYHDGRLEVLQDKDPSLEGIILLGVISLKDFREMGLLSKTESFKLQGIEESLLDQIQKILESIGLHTIADLKKKWICSKSTLKEYVLTSLFTS